MRLPLSSREYQGVSQITTMPPRRTQRIAKCGFFVFSVMEGGIEDRSVELPALKRQSRELRLDSGKERGEMLAIMLRCAETVIRIREQVNGEGAESGEREPVAHPAISSAEIDDPSAVSLEVLPENVFEKTGETAGTDAPLAVVAPRGVGVWKSEVEGVVFAASALGGTYSFV